MCLPGLAEIPRVGLAYLLRNLAKMDFCDLFRRRMTLICDFLTPKKVNIDHFRKFAWKSVSKYRVQRTYVRTNERTDNPRI